EDEKIDVAHRTPPLLPVETGRPRTEEIRRLDTVQQAQRFCEETRHPEGSRQHIAQTRVVGAGGVGPNQPRPPHPAAGEQTDGFGPFDLSVDRGVRDPARAEISDRLSSTSGAPRSSASNSACCWERKMGSSGGGGDLSTIRIISSVLRI